MLQLNSCEYTSVFGIFLFLILGGMVISGYFSIAFAMGVAYPSLEDNAWEIRARPRPLQTLYFYGRHSSHRLLSEQFPMANTLSCYWKPNSPSALEFLGWMNKGAS